MRAAFGLAGILVVIGVIVYLMGGSGGTLDQAQTALRAGETAREQVAQASGRASDGRRASQTAVLEAQSDGGRTRSVLVVSIEPESPLATHYGLRRNDSIVEIGPMKVADIVTSSEDADDFIDDAYGRRQTLTVVRDGGTITLPQAPAPGGGAGDPLQRQLDAIQRVPSH